MAVQLAADMDPSLCVKHVFRKLIKCTIASALQFGAATACMFEVASDGKRGFAASLVQQAAGMSSNNSKRKPFREGPMWSCRKLSLAGQLSLAATQCGRALQV